MIALLLGFVILTAGADRPPAVYDVGEGGYYLPNPKLTPGVTVTISQHAVCTTKWGRDVRHVTEAMKREVCTRYGANACPGPRWELDHLIPRELGGADAVDNLWPQPIREARLKDRLENFLHRTVCAGGLTVPEAQELIRTDWTRAYGILIRALDARD